MRCYCKNCETVFGMLFWDTEDDTCPLCNGEIVGFPAFETVAQWEERRGRKYPFNAPIYGAAKSAIGKIAHPWVLWPYQPGSYKETAILVIATEAGPPPDDWRPTE